MHRFALGLSLLLLALMSPSTSAAVIGYEYTGLLTFVNPVPPPPFGITVLSTATASGRFWYDTEATGMPGGLNTVLYPQQHWMTLNLLAPGFDGLEAKVFGYAVEVSDDLPQAVGPAVDRVSFVFDKSLGLDELWMVNGVKQDDGMLRVGLKAPLTARSDTSIPADLSFAVLPQPNQFFADTAIGSLDVMFMLTSLTSIPASAEPPRPCPEPSTLVLIGLGAAMAGVLRWRHSASGAAAARRSE